MTLENEELATDEQRVVKEILGDVEYWNLSDRGPNGPWSFRTLTVRRNANAVTVWDVDGVVVDRFHIRELKPADDSTSYEHVLRGRLETLADESLNHL